MNPEISLFFCCGTRSDALTQTVLTAKIRKFLDFAIHSPRTWPQQIPKITPITLTMSLTKYKQKRNFKNTPEPAGSRAAVSGALQFVVQKHQASHLHYDFRLEMEGVLKSWAVPKGPSLNPKDKRLAMMVEDHPFNYKSFEGHIPEGNYGAGDVIVWDAGTYYALGATNAKETERLMLHGLEAGKLDFFMEGSKLKGIFSLVKFKHGGENAWLLIKKDDQYASPEDILEHNQSVISGKTVKEKQSKKKISAKPEKIPTAVKPMLATLAEQPFDRPNWLFEIKWDGFRAIAEIDREIKLYSRSGQDFSQKYPEIAQGLKAIKNTAVLDGEIVAVDEAGKPHFQLLQNYARNKKRLLYYVFDILYADGKDLQPLPLLERKTILRTILPQSDIIKFSEHVEGKGTELFALASEQNIEGIMAKNGGSPYRQGQRGPEWLKIKTHKRQEAVICGFTEPKGSRHYFGSLVLGVYDNGALQYVGNSGSGFNHASLQAIFTKLKPLITKTSPFDYKVTALAPITWTKPILVCEVEFTEWTEDGQMRHPIFQGLREDKKATNVVREHEAPTEKIMSAPNSYNPSIMKNSLVSFTHLEKVYWPKEGYTKGDLIEYYTSVAEFMLPYLQDRPESLLRHPNGIDKEGFFQKNIPETHPSFVQTISLKSETDEKNVNYLVCQNKDTLLYMANLGCIEINPWNSRIKNLEYPDYAVLDLDPGDIGFDKVVIVAQEIHELLEKLGAAGYCKTSGKTGLHIFIPLGGKYTHEQSRQLSELLAHKIHDTIPATTSIVRNPAKRKDCIYIDFLQNRIGLTLAGPYSVRPFPGATVSTPLSWSEVNKKLDPAKFTIKNTLRRLEKLGDIWKPVLGKGIDMKKVLNNLSKNLS